jgi:HSP20 family protein
VSPCEQYHRIERGYGTFVRTFQLLHPIAETGVTADLRDGVLTVICPKALDTTSRRIEIG